MTGCQLGQLELQIEDLKSTVAPLYDDMLLKLDFLTKNGNDINLAKNIVTDDGIQLKLHTVVKN